MPTHYTSYAGPVESLEPAEDYVRKEGKIPPREKLSRYLARVEPTRHEWVAVLYATEALPETSRGQNERGVSNASGGPCDVILKRLYGTTLRGEMGRWQKKRSTKLLKLVGLIQRCWTKRREMPKQKECLSCDTVKAKDAFYRNSGNRDGLMSQCKRCYGYRYRSRSA